MNFKKSAITLLIVPAFVIGGCSQQSDTSVATKDGQVVQTENGDYVKIASALNDSYEQAKANGYTGTYEDWVKLLEMHQTNPQQAAQQAAQSGYDGMDMLMAGAMGMMLGNMMSSNSYSSYRSSSYGRSYKGGYIPSTPRATATRNVSKPAVRQTSSVTSKSSVTTRSSTTRGGFGGARSTGG